MSTIKSYTEWQKSEKALDDYLGDCPVEITEHLRDYIADCTSPACCTPKLLQGGDPIDHNEDGIPMYITVKTNEVTNRYYYLGILPEFQ